MDKKVYLITGATGYIGSMLIKNILANKNLVAENTIILAVVRNKEKVSQVYGNTINDALRFIYADIIDSDFIEKVDQALNELRLNHITYIYHGASVTESSQMINRPVETANGIVLGTINILELARRTNVSGMIYLSSMEAYGNIASTSLEKTTEEEQGYIDITKVRSCYPLGKRMAEHYCISYHKEYDIPVKIARLAQTFGKGIHPSDKRVFAQFAKAVKNGEDIILHTQGKSYGNYCDIEDTISALHTILLRGNSGEIYNVVNEENTMTIAQMAQLVVDNFSGGRSKVVYDIPEGNCYGYAADTKLQMSAKKLEGLGWQATKGLIEMYKDLLSEI